MWPLSDQVLFNPDYCLLQALSLDLQLEVHGIHREQRAPGRIVPCHERGSNITNGDILICSPVAHDLTYF